MTEGAFEARKWGWRQTKEGIVVSFLVHPNDINAALAVAPLGTIYAIGFREMSDGDTTGRGSAEPPPAVAPPDAEGQGRDTPRQPFRTLPPATQAVLACKDERFQRWILADSVTENRTEMAAIEVRDYCGVASRSRLNNNERTAAIWHELYARYRRDTGLEAEPR